MQTAEKQVVAHFYEIVNEGRFDRLDEVCVPTLVGHAGAGADLAELRKSLTGFRAAFPDLTSQVRNVVQEDDLISVWLTYTATHLADFAGVPASGRSVRFAAWDLIRVRRTHHRDHPVLRPVHPHVPDRRPADRRSSLTTLVPPDDRQGRPSTREGTMPFTSKESAGETAKLPGYEGHFQELEGWTVGFETYTEHADLAPYFRGLPDDACQANHHGYVLKGKLVWHYTDGSVEVTEAGHAYVTRAGHTPELFPDTEVVEFTPSDELAATMAVVEKNFEAAGG